MRDVSPTVPKHLNPYARELLEAFAGHAAASEIVIGGGVALSHYLEYRGTVDLDAWWRDGISADTRRLAHRAMEALAQRHGFRFQLRAWGETESYELLDGTQKVFSFQIGTRTRYLDAPRRAHWTPVHIETLRDNVASKMTALVERGAPRDLRDIHALCAQGLLTIEGCWQLWTGKHPDCDPREGREKVLFHVRRLELQRPLDNISPSEERAAASTLRHWYKERFCVAGAP